MGMMCQDKGLGNPTVQSAIELMNRRMKAERDAMVLSRFAPALKACPASSRRNESGASADEQLRKSRTHCGVAGGTRRGERTPLNMLLKRFYVRAESSVVARERQIESTQRPHDRARTSVLRPVVGRSELLRRRR